MNKKIINLDLNKLYLISGISFSGKSTFTNKLVEAGVPKQAIISTDTLREQVYGTYMTKDLYGVKEHLVAWSVHSDKIFDLAKDILTQRLLEDLPVFFDALNINDEERLKIAELATQLNKETEVIILDIPVEVILDRSKKRTKRFDSSILSMQMEKFEKTSVLPYQVIQHEEDYDLNIFQNLIYEKDLLVVSDLNGSLNSFISLLPKYGWRQDDNYFIPPNETQKLLFLGDIIGQGDDGFKLLELIINTSENNKCFFIIGNNEHKLLKNIEFFEKHKEIPEQKISYTDNFLSFLRLEEHLKNKIYNFLVKQKSYYQLLTNDIGQPVKNLEESKSKILFTHANIESYQPFNFIKYYGIYGQGENISSDNYDENYKLNINKHICIKSKSYNADKNDNNYIYSLEAKENSYKKISFFNLSTFIEDLTKKESSQSLFLKNTDSYETPYEINFDLQNRIAFKESVILEKDFLNSKEIEGITYIQYKNINSESKINQILSNEIIGYDKSGRVCIQTIPSLNDFLVHTFDDNEFKIQEYIEKTCFVSKHPYLNTLIVLGEKHLNGIQEGVLKSITNKLLQNNDNLTYCFAIKDKSLYLSFTINNQTKQYNFDNLEELANQLNVNLLDTFSLRKKELDKIISIHEKSYMIISQDKPISIVYSNSYYKELEPFLKEKFLLLKKEKPDIFLNKIINKKYYSISSIFEEVYQTYTNTENINETLNKLKQLKVDSLRTIKNKIF